VAGGPHRHASGVDEHHGFVRFTWRLVSPGGEVLRDGTDFGELHPDGHLLWIVGFFGPLA
jgi:hypothetical protein